MNEMLGFLEESLFSSGQKLSIINQTRHIKWRPFMKHISKRTYASKAELYAHLNEQLQEVLEGETHWIPNLSNAAALMWHVLDDINWAGFYIARGNKLYLGPFQGMPACTGIEFGSGVCGTAAATQTTQIVPNVHEFPGHIACDGETNSEIVVPLVHNGVIVGVLDIDSPSFNRFDEEDAKGLAIFAELVTKSVNWSEA